jgi:hypothetical protein
MPYLNWKDESALRQEISPVAPGSVPGSGPMRLVLGLGASHVAALLSLLQEVLGEGGGELRVDLPRNWIVFWKLREGGSRLLVAHPQPDEWVATIALSPEHAQLLLGELRGLEVGSSFALSELEATGTVSNLELTLAGV